MVAKWLGFKKASFTGRYAIRGCAEVDNSHRLEPNFMQYFGKGFRAGVIPCDEEAVYWFFTWTPTSQGEFSNTYLITFNIIHTLVIFNLLVHCFVK